MKRENLLLKKAQLVEAAKVVLPASKSESNRYLILNALSGGQSKIKNLSDSDDTAILQKALKSRGRRINVGDAGTAMRFLTAYYAITGKHKILAGSQRMHSRPIGELVGALKQLGAKIEYLGKKGFPPLEIKGFNETGRSKLQVNSAVSSQFISALMMVGPLLNGGLTITLNGRIVSKPYMKLTAKLMDEFGLPVIFKGRTIKIPKSDCQGKEVTVDGDWSSAGYWYSLFRLSGTKKLSLLGLSHDPRQGDSRLRTLMQGFGIYSRPIRGGIELTKRKHRQKKVFDLIENPDLAQTLLVLCAAMKIRGEFRGLQTLAIKETDRIKAIRAELLKLGAHLDKKSKDCYQLKFHKKEIAQPVKFKTYGDHRMAMALAPLCMQMSVIIENPEVVKKSYVEFWRILQSITKS